MPTFYFSITGRNPFADVDGQNLPTLVAAMQEAIGMAQDCERSSRRRGRCHGLVGPGSVSNAAEGWPLKLQSQQRAFDASHASRNFAIASTRVAAVPVVTPFVAGTIA
jgi:hypothetical protein